MCSVKHQIPDDYGVATNHSNDITNTQSVTRCHQILTKLRRKDERLRLKTQLFEKLHHEIYQIRKADAQSSADLKEQIRIVLKHFQEADQVRSLIRNAERAFPATFSAGTHWDATAIRSIFDSLRHENEMKKESSGS